VGQIVDFLLAGSSEAATKVKSFQTLKKYLFKIFLQPAFHRKNLTNILGGFECLRVWVFVKRHSQMPGRGFKKMDW
jgi:hypothetical protein